MPHLRFISVDCVSCARVVATVMRVGTAHEYTNRDGLPGTRPLAVLHCAWRNLYQKFVRIWTYFHQLPLHHISL